MKSRILEICKSMGFQLVIVPIELGRIAIIGIGGFPMIIFATGEYVYTGKNMYTEKIGEFVEFYGKHEIQEFANRHNIIGMQRIYSKTKP